MNNQIKELMGKTLDKKFSYTWTTLDYQDLAVFSEYFANLVVQKVIEDLETSKKGDIYTGDLFNCDWNECIDNQIAMLKEEFGLDS